MDPQQAGGDDPPAHTKFDQSGKLTDDKVREQIKGLLDALKAWTGGCEGTDLFQLPAPRYTPAASRDFRAFAEGAP